MATTTMLTATGKRRLEDELRHLREVRRPAIERLLRESGEGGDVDNAAYLDARYQYGLLNARAERLSRALANAEVVDDHWRQTDGRAAVGSRVTVVHEDGAEVDYTLVSSLEANPAHGRISTESPVGRALLGQRAGSRVEVATPASTVHLQIASVR